jgi:Helicase conserved C-terminal domain
MATEDQKQVRREQLERLSLDLLGPSTPDEVLRQNKETREGDTPTSRYLIGILYPTSSRVEEQEDDFANESGEADEDESSQAPPQITGIPKPSSIGLTLAVQPKTTMLEAEFRYGLYTPEEQADASGGSRPTILWKRHQVVHVTNLQVREGSTGTLDLPSGGRAEWLCRSADDDGVRVISVFLRNVNSAGSGPEQPEQCLFQAEIRVRGVTTDTPIVNRAHRMRSSSSDPDLESYRLLYRDKPEFAVGHGCAVDWDNSRCLPDRARLVRTEFIPTYEVSNIEAKGGVGLPGLEMEVLASAPDGQTMRSILTPLVEQYDQWIRARREEATALPIELQAKGNEHLDDCEFAAQRVREGLDLIVTDSLVFEAFKFANRTMALQRSKSVEAANFRRGMGRISDEPAPSWRPFQIAFVLLNIKGVARPDSADREIVDLLWFPTGGGKTEAYLGLAAFTMALRRLRESNATRKEASGDGGVTVVMRYTLRLLTIQQFQRAAALLCACEVLRRRSPEKFGQQPFSVALWVGGGATPNRIDQLPDPLHGRPPGALQALDNFDPQNEPSEGNPVQLRSCPWCGESLTHSDYRVVKETLHLQIRCPNKTCDFHGASTDPLSGIPAFLVDEDIYLRCPTMLIGTVDKFARLPWDDHTKALFGYVDRICERHGFLAEGLADCNGRHNAKPGFPRTDGLRPTRPFHPPELVIQDELHLITGPLGSLMGLYEVAVDYMCSRRGHRPKIVASTATIRRYQDQIRGLFDRAARQFPPAGLIAGDSFFAAESKDKPGRVYVGICSPGKSMKTAQVRILASLLHSAEVERRTRSVADVDPYWTLVDYFNSLRELGGALRLVDDDVRQRLVYLANLESIVPPRMPDRRPELTSRIAAKDISTLLTEMENTLDSGKAIDVLLSTNMISVGVDIQRFGLMVVIGQPKTNAEYIQATSRVGRQTPGLIVTLYNWTRPRDLSHYERFKTYHSMMYRHVEVSSLTPYSPRARDRGLHAVFVALLRLLDPRLSGNDGARSFDPGSPVVRDVVDQLISRIRRNDVDEVAEAQRELQAFIDGWVELRSRYPSDLKYQKPPGAGANAVSAYLLRSAEQESDTDFPKRTLNSLREVEQPSGLYFKNFRRTAG